MVYKEYNPLNSMYCGLAAYRAGLINYVYEFWHFSAGDRFAVYWQEDDKDKRYASFGAI